MICISQAALDFSTQIQADIALDPFPFGVGATTCETLWLGVPLVTVTGSPQPTASNPDTFPAHFASRMRKAFLTNIGLPELAAETLPQYVDLVPCKSPRTRPA